MKIIGLTKGMITTVDDDDYEFITNMGCWYASFSGCDYYAKRDEIIDGYKIRHYMHRVIMERSTGMEIPKGMEVDHINHNTLDNTKENLRIVTKWENNKNRRYWR